MTYKKILYISTVASQIIFVMMRFFANDFLKSKNADQASVIKLDEMGASKTFCEFDLGSKEKFNIKNLFVSNMSLNVLGFGGACALKGVYYVKKLADYMQKLHSNEMLANALNFADDFNIIGILPYTQSCSNT